MPTPYTSSKEKKKKQATNKRFTSGHFCENIVLLIWTQFEIVIAIFARLIETQIKRKFIP
jgi:hypothetical protein